MTRARIVVEGREHTYSLDDAVEQGQRFSALVRGRAVDELTGEPVLGTVAVRPAGPDLTRPAIARLVQGHTGSGGLVGVIGVPSQVLPGLAGQVYQLGLTATTPGFLPRTSIRGHGPLNAPPPFPATFAGADLGDLELHREPLGIAGRTMARNLAGQVVFAPNVTVRLVRYWRRVANPMPAGMANDLVSFSPPLTQALAPGAGVTHVGLAPTGVPKVLETDVDAGATVLRLSNSVNVAPSVVLGLEQDPLRPAPEREEYLRVSQVKGPADPLLPARVTLAVPTAVRHRRGTVVDVVAVNPQPTVPTQLVWDSLPGDVTGALAAPGGYASGFFVGVSSGPPPVAYHRITRYDAVSNALDGYFRLPQLNRVARLQLEATYPNPPVIVRALGPAYPAREQRVDFLYFV